MNTGTCMQIRPSSSQILDLPAEGQDTRYGTSDTISSLIAGLAIGRSTSIEIKGEEGRDQIRPYRN